MRVLFLDIDGVLNSTRSVAAFGGYPHSFTEKDLQLFDNVAVGLIRRLCKMGNLSIVLSSSWRINSNFRDAAVGLYLPIIDSTPILKHAVRDEITGKYRTRGTEIKMWLDEHPNVTQYAIVDDDSDMLEEQQPFFIKTEHANGLIWKDYSKLCKLFKTKT